MLTAFDSNVMKTFSESWRRESKNALDWLVSWITDFEQSEEFGQTTEE